MAGISIEVTADDLVATGLDGIVARSADMTRAMESVGMMMQTSVRRRFEVGEDPDGNPWPPSLRALTEGGRTLVDHGHLRDSVTYQASAEGVRQGTNLVYARIHQLGGTIRPRNGRALAFRAGGRTVLRRSVTMPRRSYLGVSAEDRAQARNIIADWITGDW